MCAIAMNACGGIGQLKRLDLPISAVDAGDVLNPHSSWCQSRKYNVPPGLHG